MVSERAGMQQITAKSGFGWVGSPSSRRLYAGRCWSRSRSFVWCPPKHELRPQQQPQKWSQMLGACRKGAQRLADWFLKPSAIGLLPARGALE